MTEHYITKSHFTITLWRMLSRIADWSLSKESSNSDHRNNVISPADRTAQINQHGLGILRQFEQIPFYAEQSIRETEQVVLRQVQVPLTANQFSALVSFTYGLGEANLKRSKLLHYLNAGYYRAAANEFERWVYVGPHRLPKLVARRSAEKQLFLQNDRPS